jgi:UrcA family protein
MRNAFAAVAVLALTAFAATAAGTSVDVSGMAPTLSGDAMQRRTVVQYGDLNAGDKQGAATLLDRINKAADAVCTSDRTRNSLLVAPKIKKCRAQAVAQAVKDVDTPELTTAAAAQ